MKRIRMYISLSLSTEEEMLGEAAEKFLKQIITAAGLQNNNVNLEEVQDITPPTKTITKPYNECDHFECPIEYCLLKE